MEFPEGQLLIFAKAPVSGQVKTRLAVKYGYPGAATLYKTLLRHTLDWVTRANLCPVQLHCAPSPRHPFFAACRRDYGVALQTQRGNDLGQRMDRALTHALKFSHYAVVIGSDCVSLGVPALRQALTELAGGRETVVGPAEDGGYLLIGLRRPRPTLFRGIPWGSDRVMAMTRSRLRELDVDWLELAPGWDVDHPGDVRRWRHMSRWL